ncbi:DUF4180 domain-containing protein [Actinophytocola glycyrrhizae]|uniref:DUF4180 domain-containing protein n=1 Tax=Actinophytocola glycyrrhizae TaxID=2044873 RepID=A0ABV9SB19_9PSEU
MNTISAIAGRQVLTVAPETPTLAGEQDAVDLIGEAFGHEANVVVVPADRVAADFYQLRTRVAGDVVRKFQMYRIRLVVLGDISAHLVASDAFRSFVHETNKGGDVWFLRDEEELTAKLGG